MTWFSDRLPVEELSMRILKLVTLILFVLGICSAPYLMYSVEGQSGIEEAPTGFNNGTNGFVNQATHKQDQDIFEEVETIEEGLGPVYNDTSCVGCHQNPITGAGSQILEIRAG